MIFTYFYFHNLNLHAYNCYPQYLIFRLTMNILYQHFIQQVKKQELDKYNAKHRDYLIRAGKISPNQPTKNNQNQPITSNTSTNNRAQERKPRRQRQFQRPTPTRRVDRNIPTNHQENTHTDRRNYEEQPINRPRQEEEERYFENSERVQDYQPRRPQGRQRPIKPANFSFGDQLPNENPSTETRRIMKPEIQENQYQNRFQTKTFNENIRNKNPREEKQINIPNQAQQLQEYGEVQLIECRQGCGRKFKADRIDKHQKVCQKVFQEKRKPFEVMKTNEEAEMLKKKDEKANKKQKQKERAKEKEEKKEKWKQQSEQLRYAMKKNRGEAAEQPQVEDFRIPCPYCNRKFGETAAARHIQFCKTKSKMKK